jgi:hypothetical protein
MAKEFLNAPTRPGRDPQPDPQPYKDPVRDPPFDPPDERPLMTLNHRMPISHSHVKRQGCDRNRKRPAIKWQAASSNEVRAVLARRARPA